jgi:hypothetical protein
MSGATNVRSLALVTVLAMNAELVTIPASAQVFDFTGTVTYTTGVSGALAVGTPITGTYTINYAAAIQESGVPGIPYWDFQSDGGSQYGTGLPTPAAPVFSSTVKVDAAFGLAGR